MITAQDLFNFAENAIAAEKRIEFLERHAYELENALRLGLEMRKAQQEYSLQRDDNTKARKMMVAQDSFELELSRLQIVAVKDMPF